MLRTSIALLLVALVTIVAGGDVSREVGTGSGRVELRVRGTLAVSAAPAEREGAADAPAGTEDWYGVRVTVGEALSPNWDVLESFVAGGTVRRIPHPGAESSSGRVSASVGAGGAQRTTVDVYDVAGRRVATWAAWATPSDRWDPEWDERHGSGQLVPSGVYFVRPRDGSSTSRKVIVVR